MKQTHFKKCLSFTKTHFCPLWQVTIIASSFLTLFIFHFHSCSQLMGVQNGNLDLMCCHHPKCTVASFTSFQKHCRAKKKVITERCVCLLGGPQPESLFAPKKVDSYKICGDKCATLKRTITCPHDEHHYNDDEFSSPQLGSLAKLLHRHFVWREREHTHTHTVNKVPLRTLRFIVPESKCEIAITLKVCRGR